MAVDLNERTAKRTELEKQNEQATINNNLSLRQAALQAAVELHKAVPPSTPEGFDVFLTRVTAIEDYIRGTDIPRKV